MTEQICDRICDVFRRPYPRGRRDGRPPISPEIRQIIRVMSRDNGWGAPRFVVLRHERRRIVHFNITEHPTEQWTTQQAVEVFPFDDAPPYLLRDRDGKYGARYRSRVHSLGIEEVVIAPRSPWQSPYVERLIGSIRSECLNHVIILNEYHLKQLLNAYLNYYHTARTHLALNKQCPEPRAAQPPELGEVIAIPHLGGLHHQYLRRAA